MKDFNNTFISTEHLKPEQLTSLYLKYKEVLEKSGCSVTESKTGKFLCQWDYLYVKDSFLFYTDDEHYYLSKECDLKEINEKDLDNYLKEQDMTKYEHVTDLTIGDVVNAMVNGDEFYVHSPEGYSLVLMNAPLSLLINYNNESLYRKVEEEAFWWDKHKGTLVAVRDYDYQTWKYDIFEEHSNSRKYSFRCANAGWNYMRPLTQAEKEDIISKD